MADFEKKSEFFSRAGSGEPRPSRVALSGGGNKRRDSRHRGDRSRRWPPKGLGGLLWGGGAVRWAASPGSREPFSALAAEGPRRPTLGRRVIGKKRLCGRF